MQNDHFLKISREEYEHISRALVVFDHIRHRAGERHGISAAPISFIQERWIVEGERFGQSLSDEEREEIIQDALSLIDHFLETETWHEFAWWVAEREYKRLAADCGDDEARELVTDRIYHQVMEEFFRHGVDRVRIHGIPGDALPPRRVARALKALRAQMKSGK